MNNKQLTLIFVFGIVITSLGLFLDLFLDFLRGYGQIGVIYREPNIIIALIEFIWVLFGFIAMIYYFREWAKGRLIIKHEI